MKQLILIGILLLSGCSGLLTSNQNIDQFYTLNALSYYESDHKRVDDFIMIQTPIIAKGLDDNRINLMHSPQRLDYYANARWSSSLNWMIQSSLIESFENSEVLSRVSGDTAGVKPDYQLLLEVYDFQAEYKEAEKAPRIHIKLVAKLVSYPTRDLAASFTVESFQQSEENELGTIVQAFDDAFALTQEMLMEEVLDYFDAIKK